MRHFSTFVHSILSYKFHSANFEQLKPSIHGPVAEEAADLLENLPVGHVVCIHDYSESYASRGQNERQS